MVNFYLIGINTKRVRPYGGLTLQNVGEHHALISSKTFQSSFMLSCGSEFIGFEIFIFNPIVSFNCVINLTGFLIRNSQFVKVHRGEELIGLMVYCLVVEVDSLTVIT